MAKTPVAGHVGNDAETPNLDNIIDQHAGDFQFVEEENPDDLFSDDMDNEAEVGEKAETAETTNSASDGEDAGDTEKGDMSEKDGEEEKEEKEEKEEADPKTETAPEGGIAGAIRYLEENNPDFAKAVRELQGSLSRVTADRQQFDKDKAELAAILEEVRELREEETVQEQEVAKQQKANPDSALAKIPENQRSLFVAAMQEFLEQNGYKNETVVQKEETLKAAKQYVDDIHKKAVESFGEEFGKLDDNGNLVLDKEQVPVSPKAKEMKAVRDRWTAQDKGVTWDDIYRIATFDDAVKAAEERGYKKAQEEAKKTQRTAEKIKASTVNGSSSTGSTRPVIWDKKKEGKIDPDKVYERAFNFAMRNLQE